MSFTPRTPEWYAERCAKMRNAKAAKSESKPAPAAPPAAPGLAAAPAREIKRRIGYVRWSMEEIEKVAKLAAHYLLNQGIHFIPDPYDRTGNQFLLQAIQRAQGEVLPAERRRGFIKQRQGISDAFWKELKTCLKQGLGLPLHFVSGNGHKPAVAPTAPATVPPSPEYHPDAAADSTTVQTVLSVGDAPTELLVSTLINRLFRLMEKNSAPVKVTELERQLEERRQYDEMIMAELSELRKQVEALTPQLKLPLDTMTPFPKREVAEKLPRVAILGCRKDQYDVIAHEVEKLGIKLDLRHYDQDARPVPVNADWSVTLRWVRHHWDDQLNVPRGQSTFVRGGVGQAVQQLQQWFAPQTVKVTA